MVNGLPNINSLDQLCEACILVKSHRLPFLGEPWQAKQRLERIHTYVCGPTNITTIGGNRSPTRSVRNMTPIEAWSGFKPNVHHLRVFGSVAYTHVSAATITKLDDQVEKTVLVLEEERDVAVAIPGVNPDNAVRVTIPCCTPADATEDTGNHSVGTPVAVPSVTASTTIQTALTGRPRRQHQLPAYLHDYEVSLNDEIDDNDLAHFAFLAALEHVNYCRRRLEERSSSRSKKEAAPVALSSLSLVERRKKQQLRTSVSRSSLVTAMERGMGVVDEAGWRPWQSGGEH
nr:Retrovirus-related Pol polyprotein from transposon TNT 1-94 [Ipomoea batatas]